MKLCIAAVLLLALGACTGASINSSAGIGTGTRISIGAAVDGNGVRPSGSITQKIF